MGPKKKPKSRRQPPPDSPAPKVNVDKDKMELESAGYAEIRKECEKALHQLHKSNFPKAHVILKKAISGHQDKDQRPLSAALIHRTRATVLAREAFSLDSQKEKQRCWRAEFEEARKAAEFSPNSVEYAHYYAMTVYDIAGEEEEEYKKVIRECERALGVSNPVDPMKEAGFFEKMILKTEEERIAKAKRDLQRLKQRAVISSISCWLKSVGVNCQVIRLGVIPVIRDGEDQLTRMPSESDKISKTTKTTEERRKEIEANIVLARIMAELKKVEVMRNEKGRGEEGNEKEKEGEVERILQELKNPEAGKRNDKRAERRKYGSDARDLEGINRFKGFWNSMNVEMKRDGFLKIRVSDLKGFFGSKDEKALEVLNEVLRFVEEKKTWRFWECCECRETLGDWKSMEGHVKKHIWKLTPELQMVLPDTMEKEEMLKILGCSFTPVDVPSAVKLLGDCCEDSESSRDHVVYPNNFWPVCEDSKLRPLLGRINCLFTALITLKCLSKFHIEVTQQFTLEEFEKLASGYHFLKHKVHQTPIGICFLEAHKLEKISEFLERMLDSCKLDSDSDRSGILSDGSIVNQWDEVEGVIVLNEDASWLHLDENLLPLDHAPDDTPAADSSFLWIFSGPSSGDPLQSWKRKKEQKVQQGKEIFKALEKLFHSIENLCKQKLGLIDALKVVEGRFSGGIMKEKQIDETEGKTEFELMRSILRHAEPSIVNELRERDMYLSSIKIGELDAQILRNRAEWHELECKFEHVSANDYRQKLLPLVKSYLRAQLEDLAKEKSDAAAAALLAEVELDSKRGFQGRNDNLRSSKEKAKDKKKPKQDNRVEESKASNSSLDPDGPQLLGNVPHEQASPHVTDEGEEEEELRRENLQSVKEGPLEHQEEELRLEDQLKPLVKESTPVGIGLRNNAGENNCFLNVIIQPLWHLRQFRNEFLERTEHVHVGDSCVFCGLLDVFTELRTAYTNLSREAVAPNPLRIALSKSSTTNFQMRQMNDPDEAFLKILTKLHDSAPTNPSLSISDSESVRDMGPWSCTKVGCIAHSLFGINKLRDMGPLNTTFNYHIAASALRKEPGIQNAFEKILQTDVITNPPHIFTTVLGWEGGVASAEDKEATLETLSTEIDLNLLLHHSTGSQHKHKLVSVVNYHPRFHYSCFIYSHEHDWWVRYDDEIVEVIGSWTDVLSKYKNRCIQPYILFFEDAN